MPVKAQNPIGLNRLIVAMLLPLVVFALQSMFWVAIKPFAWFLFFPAVFFSAWIGGLSGGVIATLISTALAWWAFIPPERSFALESPFHLVSIAMFMGMGFLFAYTQERIREANRKAAEARDELTILNQLLEQKVEERTAALRSGIVERQRAEEEINRLFTLSLDLLCVAGFDGYFKRLNPAWERVFGFITADLLEKPYREFVHPDDRDATLTEADRLAQGASVISLENRYRCKDGSYRWLQWAAYPIVEEQLVYAAARDITERKRAEGELNALSRAAVNILDDFDGEKQRLGDVQRATVNILEDFDREKSRLEEGQRATLNILEDFDTEKAQLQGSQRALLNILDDIEVEKSKVQEAGQALRASEERTRLIVDRAHDAFIAMDVAGVITDWNPQAERIFGWSRAEALGCRLAETIIPAQYREAHSRGLQHFLATGEGPVLNQRLELTALHRDGHEFPVELSITPLRTGDRWIFAAFLRDITERQRAQARLQEVNTELGAANQELEAFTYSVSHDLRAPLRHIDGFSRLLLEEHSQKLPEEARHYLERVREGTQQMGSLVDDLLNLSRVARQELRRQATGLGSLVEEARRELKAELEGREVEWRIGALPFADCDPTLVKQVFANLLSNAVKFTRPRRPARIEVGARTENGAPAIFVRDNGVGFSMKYADKLFGVFQRLHRPEDFEGTGVGLATVQRIIQKHGGQVWAEAELDKGAAFYFTLQAPPSGQALPAIPTASQRGES